MLNIEKERETFEALFEEKLGAHRCQFDLDSDGNYEDRETVCAWHMYLAGLNKKLEGCVVVPINNTTIVAVEKMVEQQVEASGITADVFRLDGEKILNAIVEAARGGE